MFQDIPIIHYKINQCRIHSWDRVWNKPTTTCNIYQHRPIFLKWEPLWQKLSSISGKHLWRCALRKTRDDLQHLALLRESFESHCPLRTCWAFHKMWTTGHWIQRICWEKCKSTVTSRIYQFFSESGCNFRGKPTSSKRACHRNLHLLNRSGLKKRHTGWRTRWQKRDKRQAGPSWRESAPGFQTFTDMNLFFGIFLFETHPFLYRNAVKYSGCGRRVMKHQDLRESRWLQRVQNLEHSYSISTDHVSDALFILRILVFLQLFYSLHIAGGSWISEDAMWANAWNCLNQRRKCKTQQCTVHRTKSKNIWNGSWTPRHRHKHLFRSGKITKSYKIHIHSQISNICPHASCFACP